MRLSQEQKFALDIHQSVASLFDTDDENFKYALGEIDLTKFFTAMIMANQILYKEITGEDDGDLIDFLTLQTRLVFQYLNEQNKEDE